ncbi:MAG: VanZ family protein [Pseudonocardiales bacterium]|nr:VanZ family protein [Pseudonocardiales bacterium]
MSDTVLSVWDGVDLNYHNLINIFLHHLEVPTSFIPGSLLLGGAAWWWGPRQGWDRKFAVLAGCSLALALALTVVRPLGHFPTGGLSPLATLRVCTVGSFSLVHLYEELNVVMLVPFAIFGTLATRRPVFVTMSSMLVSAFIEYVQGATGGGECQLRDIAHNSLGAVLGVLIAVLVLRLRPKQSPEITASVAAGSGSPR